MSTRQEIIAHALRQRHAEICRSASYCPPNAFGEMSDFVEHLRKQMLRPEPARSPGADAVEGKMFRKWAAPRIWFGCEYESLDAIRILAAEQELECSEVAPPENTSFLRSLQTSGLDPERRFHLLTTRYLHPLNVAAPSEGKIREYLLERLMVADRSRIERQSLALLNADDLLLRLNLIAINASLTDDLRYLDALNYYYELLPANWYPQSPQNWLRVTFLSFYVRALAVHFTHLIECV